MEKRNFYCLALAAMSLGILSTNRLSADTTWQATIGDWSTPGNWSGGEPNSTAFADINNGGTVQIGANGYEYTNAGVLALGEATGQSGSVSMSNGMLTTSGENIGINGTGTFVQSGGTNNVSAYSGILGIGVGDGPTGSTYTLSGNAVLNSSESILYGEFDQTGGTNNCPSLYLSYTQSGTGSFTGIYRLSAGTLTVGEASIGGQGTALFSQTGGSLVCNGQYGTYIQTGGTMSIVNASDTIDYLTNQNILSLAGASGTNTAGQLYASQYIQKATTPAVAELDIGIGGAIAGTGYGQLEVNSASLSGSLVVTLTNGFIPHYGQTFFIIDNLGGTDSGSFTTTSLPSGNWGSFALHYTSSGVSLTVVPEPGVALLGAGCLLLCGRRRR